MSSGRCLLMELGLLKNRTWLIDVYRSTASDSWKCIVSGYSASFVSRLSRHRLQSAVESVPCLDIVQVLSTAVTWSSAVYSRKCIVSGYSASFVNCLWHRHRQFIVENVPHLDAMQVLLTNCLSHGLTFCDTLLSSAVIARLKYIYKLTGAIWPSLC